MSLGLSLCAAFGVHLCTAWGQPFPSGIFSSPCVPSSSLGEQSGSGSTLTSPKLSHRHLFLLQRVLLPSFCDNWPSSLGVGGAAEVVGVWLSTSKFYSSDSPQPASMLFWGVSCMVFNNYLCPHHCIIIAPPLTKRGVATWFTPCSPHRGVAHAH